MPKPRGAGAATSTATATAAPRAATTTSTAKRTTTTKSTTMKENRVTPRTNSSSVKPASPVVKKKVSSSSTSPAGDMDLALAAAWSEGAPPCEVAQAARRGGGSGRRGRRNALDNHLLQALPRAWGEDEAMALEGAVDTRGRN